MIEAGESRRTSLGTVRATALLNIFLTLYLSGFFRRVPSGLARYASISAALINLIAAAKISAEVLATDPPGLSGIWQQNSIEENSKDSEPRLSTRAINQYHPDGGPSWLHPIGTCAVSDY